MFMNFRRVRKRRFLQLISIWCVLSTLVLFWEQVDHHIVSHMKAFSYRYLINNYDFIKKNLQLRQETRRFVNHPYLIDHKNMCTEKDLLLLLFIKSSPDNFSRRQSIRSTWGNKTYIKSELGVTVKVVFVMGLIPDPLRRDATQKKLQAEDKIYGDLVQQEFLDTFHNLTVKLLMQFHWTHVNCAHARFLMTADDDVFIHIPNLVHTLQKLDHQNVNDLWVGHVYRGAPPVRQKTSKYFVSVKMYQWVSYPDYTAGGGYVMSGDVAAKIYQAMLSLKADFHIDDVFMGISAIVAGVSPQDHVYFSGEAKAPYHPCIYEKMITSHGHQDNNEYLWKVATAPEVKSVSSGFFGKLYCTVVKISLLCRPYLTSTYACKAAFL